MFHLVAALNAIAICFGIMVGVVLFVKSPPEVNNKLFYALTLPWLIAIVCLVVLRGARKLRLAANWLFAVAIVATLLVGVASFDDLSRSGEGGGFVMVLALALTAVVAGSFVTVPKRAVAGPNRASHGVATETTALYSSAGGLFGDIFASEAGDWIAMEEEADRVTFRVRQKRRRLLRNNIILNLLCLLLLLAGFVLFWIYKDSKDPRAVLLIIVALLMLMLLVMLLVGIGKLYGSLKVYRGPEQVTLTVTRDSIVASSPVPTTAAVTLPYREIIGPYYVEGSALPHIPSVLTTQTITVGGGTGLPGMVHAGMAGAKGAFDSAVQLMGLATIGAANFLSSGARGLVYVDRLGKTAVLARHLGDGEARFLAEKMADAIVKLRAE